MKNYYFIFLGIFIFQVTQQAQAQRCGQEIYDSIQFAKYPALKKSREKFEKQLALRQSDRQSNRIDNTTPQGVITIPVVVHVVYNSSGQNISDAQIASQITILNQDYRKKNADMSLLRPQFADIAADVEIEFQLATIDPNCQPTNGITRHQTSHAPFTMNEEDIRDVKSYGYWPADKYLNIWVCTFEDSRLLGYSTYPTAAGIDGLEGSVADSLLDGVVVKAASFGKVSSVVGGKYNLGRTATHEVGHWLGLFHLWGESEGVCGTDYCNDTPPQQFSSSECEYIASTSCSNQSPMLENYMDYSFDKCMNAFTSDQKMRMRDAIAVSERRNRLLTSIGAKPLAVLSTKLPLMEGFENSSWLSKWDTNKVSGNHTFEIANEGAYSKSVQSISVNNHSGSLSVTELVLPACNFIGLQEPIISFDHALGLAPGQTGTLTLYYALGCSTNWTSVTSWSADELHTLASPGGFIPAAGQWGNRFKSLSVLKGLTYVQLKLVWETSSSVQLYLDNIQLVENEFVSNLYPNPAKEYFNVEVHFPGIQSWSIEMYDAYGSKVLFNESRSAYSEVKQVSVAGLQAGVYFVNIISSYSVERKKVIVKVPF